MDRQKELTKLLNEMATKLYQQQGGPQGGAQSDFHGGAQGGNTSGGADDDVVDADFKEV